MDPTRSEPWWVINGPLWGSSCCGSDHPLVYAKRIAIDRIEELLTSQYKYNFNEQGSAEQEEMSREENKFVEIMESSAQLQNGHYTFQMPFKLWYIPHHGVYRPWKGKLRVVFDCGAEYKGVSLNGQLLQGLNLTSSLVGDLMRFK